MEPVICNINYICDSFGMLLWDFICAVAYRLTYYLFLQTQQRITVTNNEENKEGFLYKELEDAPNELVNKFRILQLALPFLIVEFSLPSQNQRVMSI